MMTISNPLLQGIACVHERVAVYKDHARQFYFETLLSEHPCPSCGGRLSATGPSECTCSCGVKLDPTVEFQRSPCCTVKLRRAKTHYVCTDSGTTVPSRFLFDEMLFDASYFSEHMKQSRERKRKRREELKRLLASTHSGEWHMDDTSAFGALPGLSAALDEYIRAQEASVDTFETISDFKLEVYRHTIISAMDGCTVRFEALPALCKDRRLDKARCFMTLLFMENAREGWLEERPDSIMVRPYEAHG